ncbi:MAG: 1-acyl-sn-glycerol-3-phosphate acyltransferase [Treponema sp.]|nr:1-acyl-sn-glycerol-3-phosphate acyltransferase [Candidatus Treponema equifaecale]
MENESIQQKLLYEPQKIKNYPLYFWRVFAKLVSLVVFAIGTILLSVVCFPILKIIFPKKSSFKYHARHLVYVLFNVFLGFVKYLGALKIKTNKPGYLKSLKSAIVVANHPAYLDSPVMISQLKHTSVIAKAALSKRNVMTAVINQLYMPNSLEFDEILKRSKEDLENGNTIMMFPEGTRSTKYGQNRYKKGCARISLATGCPIIPVYIGGTDKLGFGKGDKVLQYNHRETCIFDLQVKDPIYPEEFKDLPEAIAAKRMTAKIREVLDDDVNKIYRY